MNLYPKEILLKDGRPALLRPVELSIGVVTSLIGAVACVVIFYRSRTVR